MIKNAIWLFAFAVFALAIFLPSYTKMQDLLQINIEYRKEIGDLRKENAKLKEQQKMLESNPDYLEKVAREKMGLIKDGETVYKITPALLPEGSNKQ